MPIRLTIEQLAAAKVCIVAGSGRDFFAEFAAAQALGRADVLAVNFTACFIAGPVHHMASLHYQEIGAFRACRRCLDYCQNHHDDPITHSYKPWAGVDRVWPEWDSEEGRKGTSALFAVRVALALGYERVILTGVPLDATGRHYDPPGVKGNGYDARSLREAWEKAAVTEFAGRVTSMGDHWTAKLLGGPTR